MKGSSWVTRLCIFNAIHEHLQHFSQKMLMLHKSMCLRIMEEFGRVRDLILMKRALNVTFQI